MEAAEEVFAVGEVDACLSAYGGVDLGEQGGGHLDVVDAAHVDGGEKAACVAEDAAAESEEQCAAISAKLMHLSCEGFDGGEALESFAGGQEEDRRGGARRERGEKAAGPEGPDLGRGEDDEATAAGEQGPQAGVEAGEESGTENDAVGGGGSRDRNRSHAAFMVSQGQVRRCVARAAAC